ncbi:MAG: peptidylprolyl isomerase [Thaumarchaeota archaeon]|nr:peptidylprolyl isomerase [Nitrososphaerota archaeon]
MPLEKGTLIYANYTAKVKDTGEAIETTLEAEAKKLKIYDAEKKYEPRLVSVGEGWILAGLDEEIKKMDVGQKKEIELLPSKAFGERDPAQLRMVPLRKFGEKAHELEVGDQVEIDNRVATVRFIGSGRAQVDFNHRLAGKTVVYDFEVVKKVETQDDKIKALIKRRFGAEGEKVKYTVKAGELQVEIPEDLFLAEGLQIIKRGISTDVFHFTEPIREVTFVEKFASKKEEKKLEEKKPVELKTEEKELEPKRTAARKTPRATKVAAKATVR